MNQENRHMYPDMNRIYPAYFFLEIIYIPIKYLMFLQSFEALISKSEKIFVEQIFYKIFYFFGRKLNDFEFRN